MTAFPVLACLLVIVVGSQRISARTNDETDRPAKTQILALPLDSMDGLEVNGLTDGANPVNVQANVAIYQERHSVQFINNDGPTGSVSGGQILAIVKSSVFKDGTIEADVASFPREGAQAKHAGFIRYCIPCSRSRLEVRSFLLANDQQARQRPIAAQPLGPVCVPPRTSLGAGCVRESGDVRILRRS